MFLICDRWSSSRFDAVDNDDNTDIVLVLVFNAPDRSILVILGHPCIIILIIWSLNLSQYVKWSVLILFIGSSVWIIVVVMSLSSIPYLNDRHCNDDR